MRLVSSRLPVDARALGADCDNCPLNGRKPVAPSPVKRPLLAVVTESPSQNDTGFNKLLSGPSGELFDRITSAEGVSRQRIHVTSAVLCRPEQKLEPHNWRKAIECCRPRLERELKTHEITHALLLGDRAQQTIMNKVSVFDWMGPPVRGIVWRKDGKPWKALKKQPEPPEDAIRFDDIEFISTVAVGYCLANPQYTPILRKHFRRIVLRAKGELPDWKWPREFIDNGKGTDDALRWLNGLSSVAVDIETTKKEPRRLLNVGIADIAVSVSVSWETASPTTKQLVKEILANERIAKEFWNMAFDVPQLENFGLTVSGRIDDWMLAFLLIAPRVRHGLAHASAFEFHVERWKEHFKKKDKEAGKDYDEFASADPYERSKYNGRDTYVTKLLGNAYREYLKKLHRGEELYENAINNTMIAMRMSRDGVKVNRSILHTKRVELTKKLESSNKLLVGFGEKMGIDNFNPNSRPQLLDLFQKRLKVELPRNKEGKVSVDKKALEDLCTNPNGTVRGLSRALLDNRAAHKKLAYLKALDVDGRVHPIWKPGKAKTGRWASNEPNLMNIPKPKKGDPDSGLRDVFEAEEDCFLVELDYSALEARIIALIAGDEQLLEWFNAGVDVHVRTAALCFGVDDSAVTKDERETLKQVRYAFQYASAPETAWRQNVVKLPHLTLKMVEVLFDKLRALHPAIVKAHTDWVNEAHEKDCVECPGSGRRHTFHGQVDMNQAINLRIQMFASYLIDAAMRRIVTRLQPGEKLIMQIHDSLICEGPVPKRLHDIMKEEMERPIELNGKQIVFTTEGKWGKNWGKMQAFEN